MDPTSTAIEQDAWLDDLRRRLAVAQSWPALQHALRLALQRHLGVELACLATALRGARRARLRSIGGTLRDALAEPTLTLDGTACGEVIESRRERIYPRLAGLTQPDLRAAFDAGATCCAVVVLPTRVGRVGALLAAGRQQECEDPRALALLVEIGRLVGERLQTIDEVKPAPQADGAIPWTERMETVLHAGQALGVAPDQDALFNTISSYIPRMMTADRISLTIPESDTHFRILGVDGIEGATPSGTTHPLAGTCTAEMFRERRSRRYDSLLDTEFTEHKSLAERGVRSSVSVPVEAGGRFFGTLNVGSRTLGTFDADDEVLLQHLGSLLGTAMLSQERQRDLDRQRQAAERDSQAKSAFLAALSHEIRTPLHGLLGVTGLLLETTVEKATHDLLVSAHGSAEDLLRALSDILDYSKLVAGEMDLRPRVVEATEPVRLSVQGLREEAERKGLELALRIDGPPTDVELDDLRLRQVLDNLISNAIKFTDAGRIDVICHLGETANPAHSALEITVLDTGCGIAEAQQEHLFEPFRQETRRVGGRGLGLPLARELVGLLGGRFDLDSMPGHGTRVTVSLEPQRGRVGLQRIEAEWVPSRDMRVLVVDDNSVNRLIIRRLLEKLGIEAGTAGDGAEAVHAVEEDHWDLVLMDLQMPNVDGFEATERILNGAAEAPPIVVALTANVTNTVRDRCMGLGMKDFLTKPLKRERLLEVLQQVEAAAEQR